MTEQPSIYSAQEQPEPTKNNLPASWDLVTKDIQDRDQMGLQKYKTRLQPFNGRDTLTDVYQELLDAVVYIRTALYERDNAKNSINALCDRVHAANQKWWVDLETGEPIKRNVGELLCLVHSEISEALEGDRKNLQDDKLPHRKMIEVELADAVIRIFDICAGLGLDLGGAFEEKMAYNAIRQDHSHAHRLTQHGKKY